MANNRSLPSNKNTLHPAFAVSNIKVLIPVTLDIKQDEYSSWVLLFQLHLQAHNLLFLIDSSSPTPDLDDATILQLDALCRQWMFSTMTKDLMLTVLKTGKTAKDLWDHLKRLFQDNKRNRAASLESKFVNLRFIDCNNVDDYCDKLQALSSRLSDLEFPMDEKRLVIQLVNGLPEEYNTVASFIQQSMPSFDTARSQLRTEDIRPPLLPNPTGPVLSQPQLPTESNRSPLLPNPASPFPPYPHWAYPATPWNVAAPGPYPATPYWASPWNAASPASRGRGRQNRGRGRGRGRHPTAGRSPQAYIAPTTDYLQPSDIAEAYSSMSIRTPDDDFYMDTGETSHITSDPGLEFEEDYSPM
ncbi:uncharacterized protein LOC113351446 [Papaver somniferum]|uniref:uncharacterized protein LOC113351446 n=1 Tax=Papaver somniferum TaxID=3469 RepID=UPI000E7006D8|nr:uncharacterized protein LOC113351446 [Papaver somniferum]